MALWGLLSFSCSKSSSQTPQPGKPLVTEKGTAQGAVAERSIGAQGGMLVSDDKRVELTIPAGAVSTNTTFRLQAITNVNPASAGLSYRITPAIKFAKPVRIKIDYSGEDSLNIDPCNLGLGYQDSSGAWKMKLGRQIDPTARTITFNTDRTGDWCLLSPVKLIPANSTIKRNGQVKLQVLSFIPNLGDQDACGQWKGSDDHHSEQAMLFGTPISPEYIDRWAIAVSGAGIGKLTAQGASATYQASAADDPDPNPVTIVVHFKDPSRKLYASIFVEPEDTYIMITIGGKTYLYTTVEAIYDRSANGYAVRWEERPSRIERGVITWERTPTGTHAWGKTGASQFLFTPEDIPNDGFYISFIGEEAKIPSGGNVVISEFGEVGQLVLGTFVVVEAGLHDPDQGYRSSHTLKGKFKARRKE